MANMTDFFSPIFENEGFHNFITRGGISVLIIILGIILARFIRIFLSKISKKLELNKHIRGSFIELFLILIEVSIDIIFINIGLKRLGISLVNNFLDKILLIIPAITGALVILAIGFAIAIYLRDVLEDAEVTGWDLISKTIFFFVLYVFGAYALRLALISFSELTIDIIIISFTIIIATTIAYSFVKKNTQKHQ